MPVQKCQLMQGGREPNSTDPKHFNGVVAVLVSSSAFREVSASRQPLTGKTSEVLKDHFYFIHFLQIE